MTIADVLTAAGWPLGRGGHRARAACPIHRGANDQAFSYTDRFFFCFACGEKGGPRRLAELLGVGGAPGMPRERNRRPLEGLEELPPPVAPPRAPERLSVRLEALRLERREQWLRTQDREHREADQLLGRAETLLDLAGQFPAEHPLRDSIFDIAAEMAGRALARRDAVDSVLGCRCRDVRS